MNMPHGGVISVFKTNSGLGCTITLARPYCSTEWRCDVNWCLGLCWNHEKFCPAVGTVVYFEFRCETTVLPFPPMLGGETFVDNFFLNVQTVRQHIWIPVPHKRTQPLLCCSYLQIQQQNPARLEVGRLCITACPYKIIDCKGVKEWRSVQSWALNNNLMPLSASWACKSFS